jgi:hypothetical protein
VQDPCRVPASESPTNGAQNRRKSCAQRTNCMRRSCSKSHEPSGSGAARRMHRERGMLAFASLLSLLLATPARLMLGAESRLFIDGDSNLRQWSCDSAEVRLDAAVETGSPRRPPSVQSMIIDVAVGSLRCGDEHMDDKLRESLKAEQFPVIRYRLGEAVALRGAPAGQYLLLVRGTLAVAGVTRNVQLEVRASATPEGELRASGSLPLLMSDFGLEPPSALFGIVQSKNEIVVRFDFRGRSAALTN